MKLEYLYYKLDKPRYTPDRVQGTAADLRHAVPHRRAPCPRGHLEIPEEEIYLGEIPIMLGGGEFIVNGAERVIVSQLHRSPGVDFGIASDIGDRPLHSARIIPERGSWIELEVTKKDVLAMRIDQSPKIAATIFLRALDETFSSPRRSWRLFYDVAEVKVARPQARALLRRVHPQRGRRGTLPRRCTPSAMRSTPSSSSCIKKIRVVKDAERSADPQHPGDGTTRLHGRCHRARGRPASNLRRSARQPAAGRQGQGLFKEKFFDENRYRLGKVGRFRINRKFDMDVPEDVMHIRAEDFLAVIRTSSTSAPSATRPTSTTSITSATAACARSMNSPSRRCARAS